MKKLFALAIPFLIVVVFSSCNQGEVSDLHTQLDSAKAQVAALQNQVHDLQSKLDDVKDVSGNLEGAIDSLKDQLEDFDYGTKKDNFDHVQDAALAIESSFDELQKKLDK